MTTTRQKKIKRPVWCHVISKKATVAMDIIKYQNAQSIVNFDKLFIAKEIIKTNEKHKI